MRREYNFKKLKGHKNPYAKALKRPVTIRLGADIIDYFKGMADQMGIPYQSLINLYLKDCVESQRRIKWAA